MTDLSELITAFETEIGKLNLSAENYRDAKLISYKYGDILGKLLRERFAGAQLTEEDIHSIIKPMLQKAYRASADVAVSVQDLINTTSKIGMASARPSSKAFRIDNLAEKLMDEGADAEFLLGNDVLENVCEDAVIATFKMNAEQQESAGLSMRFSRKSTGKCCDWCESVSGTFYSFEDLPDGFFAMHKDCTCFIDYHVAKVHHRINAYVDAGGRLRKRTQEL